MPDSWATQIRLLRNPTPARAHCLNIASTPSRAVWRGIAVPDVLLSGDHGKVDRFRRDEALARTAEIRPDLIAALDCKALDKADRKTLMALGWEVSAAIRAGSPINSPHGGRFTTRRNRRNALYPSRHPRIRCRRRRFRRSCGFR